MNKALGYLQNQIVPSTEYYFHCPVYLITLGLIDLPGKALLKKNFYYRERRFEHTC